MTAVTIGDLRRKGELLEVGCTKVAASVPDTAARMRGCWAWTANTPDNAMEQI